MVELEILNLIQQKQVILNLKRFQVVSPTRARFLLVPSLILTMVLLLNAVANIQKDFHIRIWELIENVVVVQRLIPQ